jgi:hypothetical protein
MYACMQCNVCLEFKTSITVLRCGHPVCGVCYHIMMHPEWRGDEDPAPNPRCPSCQASFEDMADNPPSARENYIRQLSPWNIGEIQIVSPEEIGLVSFLKRILCTLYQVIHQRGPG